jgi:hypothetical protein
MYRQGISEVNTRSVARATIETAYAKLGIPDTLAEKMVKCANHFLDDFLAMVPLVSVRKEYES